MAASASSVAHAARVAMRVELAPVVAPDQGVALDQGAAPAVHVVASPVVAARTGGAEPLAFHASKHSGAAFVGAAEAAMHVPLAIDLHTDRQA